MESKAAILAVAMLVCAGLAADLGATDLTKYTQPGKDKDEHPGWVLIAENKGPLTFILTIMATLPGVASVYGASRKTRKKNKELIVRCLQLVHVRSFPHPQAGMSDDHRVSLFVPAREKRPKFPWLPRERVLRCEHRTGGSQPGRTWALSPKRPKQSEDQKNDLHEGLVVQAWILQATITVAPPILSDHNDIERYCREARMTEETRNARSWKDAGMHAVPLITGGAEPLAILLVESKGKPVACSELQWDAKTMAILLGDKP